MTARDLAAACGFSVSTARRVINGERALTCCDVARIAEDLEIDWSVAIESPLRCAHDLLRGRSEHGAEVEKPGNRNRALGSLPPVQA